MFERRDSRRDDQQRQLERWKRARSSDRERGEGGGADHRNEADDPDRQSPRGPRGGK
jgi:hypothetical protein